MIPHILPFPEPFLSTQDVMLQNVPSCGGGEREREREREIKFPQNKSSQNNC
jgi:hypothetical protein